MRSGLYPYQDIYMFTPSYSGHRSGMFEEIDERGIFLPFQWMKHREQGSYDVGLQGIHRRRILKKSWVFRSRNAVGCPTKHIVSSDNSSDSLHRSFHSAMQNVRMWDSTTDPALRAHRIGAVYNFGFSKDGSMMLAGCDKKALLWMDPLNRKVVAFNPAAHLSAVNYISFIDSNRFATASDDRLVKVWDLRKFNECQQTFSGHKSWVKNVEYYEGHLISSSFDGEILLWDVNENTSADTPKVPRLLFRTDSLIRTTIAPLSKKLFISTKSGFIMVVNDLDLNSIFSDLKGFDPTQYVRMLRNHDTSQAHLSTPLFSQRKTRNRIELIADFHQESPVYYIVSVKIDPLESMALTRNIEGYTNTEWTCVHDLSDNPTVRPNPCDKLSILKHVPQQDIVQCPPPPDAGSGSTSPFTLCSLPDAGSDSSGPCMFTCHGRDPRDRDFRSSPFSQTGEAARDSFSPFQAAGNIVTGEPLSNLRGVEHDTTQYDDNLPRVNVVCSEALAAKNEKLIHERVSRILCDYAGKDIDVTLVLNCNDPKTFVLSNDSLASPFTFVEVHKNKPRLLYYLRETTSRVSIDYIKEVGFSPDGRVVTSPLPRGIHLLAFDTGCTELLDGGSDRDVRELTEIASISRHPSVVVSTQFSPTNNILVSGCLAGQIGFYQPVL